MKSLGAMGRGLCHIRSVVPVPFLFRSRCVPAVHKNAREHERANADRNCGVVGRTCFSLCP